ncbi:hypothetical protein ACCO45_001132 [Purpureocillium lilacinum]|uniref:Uncharacterized protein n=1 Tax=Purpureocillium lilacinum TaxID=33203 RepID=A0ACC4E7D1_PURLI
MGRPVDLPASWWLQRRGLGSHTGRRQDKIRHVGESPGKARSRSPTCASPLGSRAGWVRFAGPQVWDAGANGAGRDGRDCLADARARDPCCYRRDPQFASEEGEYDFFFLVVLPPAAWN